MKTIISFFFEFSFDGANKVRFIKIRDDLFILPDGFHYKPGVSFVSHPIKEGGPNELIGEVDYEESFFTEDSQTFYLFIRHRWSSYCKESAEFIKEKMVEKGWALLL